MKADTGDGMKEDYNILITSNISDKYKFRANKYNRACEYSNIQETL